jgi:adenylate cyclase
MERRLAAILAADVVGYSRLMHADEAGTMSALKARRKEVLEPHVSKHKGRVFKVSGDGVLVEFASAVNALQCAVDLQQAMAVANRGLPDDHHVVLRIGVNLGDVMAEGGDLYGDGVNVAARLEAIAEPGGIVISSTVHDYIRNKIKVAFDDLGTQSLKNIAEPVHAYRVTGTPAVVIPTSVFVSDKPSIAVLPFINLSGDPGQEYFSEGLTEDIITELSRFRSLLVVARNSSFTFKGKTVDVKEVGRKLGARYVVEGSVRRAGNRIRITAQLLDSTSGSHLWAERYDLNVEDVFSIQDEIMCTIVANLPTYIEEAECRRALQRARESFSAYDHWLRGKHFLQKGRSREVVLLARQHFQKAVELDPNYAAAYVDLAESYYAEYHSPWTTSREDAAEQIFKLGRRAVELDPRDSRTHLELAWAYLNLKGDFDLAKVQIEEAIALNPNDYYNYCFGGWLAACSGDLEHAVACSNEAVRRSPLVSDGCLHTRVVAEYLAANYAESITAFGKMLHPDPVVHAWISAAYGQLGREGEARVMATEFIRLVKELPWAPKDMHSADWRNYWSAEFPTRDSNAREHLFNGLRKAGFSV